jgi:hypothetical protein
MSFYPLPDLEVGFGPLDVTGIDIATYLICLVGRYVVYR